MKQINFLFLIGLIFFATACKKDKTTPEPTKSELIKGSWTLQKFSSHANLKITVVGETDIDTLDQIATAKNLTTEFNEDKTFKTSGSITIKTTKIADGDTEIIEKTVSDSMTVGTWNIDNNTLTLYYTADTNKYTITNLTSSNLNLEESLIESTLDSIWGIVFQLDINGKAIREYKK